MTATFNLHLLDTLESMTGIRILPVNYFWSGHDGMARRNIHIQHTHTPQHFRVIKSILSDVLADNLQKKAIIYTNTASLVERIKDHLDGWMDMHAPFKGDIINSSKYSSSLFILNLRRFLMFGTSNSISLCFPATNTFLKDSRCTSLL